MKDAVKVPHVSRKMNLNVDLPASGSTWRNCQRFEFHTWESFTLDSLPHLSSPTRDYAPVNGSIILTTRPPGNSQESCFGRWADLKLTLGRIPHSDFFFFFFSPFGENGENLSSLYSPGQALTLSGCAAWHAPGSHTSWLLLGFLLEAAGFAGQ